MVLLTLQAGNAGLGEDAANISSLLQTTCSLKHQYRMKNTNQTLVLSMAAALLLLSGCATTPQIETRTATPAGSGAPVGAETLIPASSVGKLNVSIQTQTLGDTPQGMAGSITNLVAGALNQERFSVIRGNADLTIQLNVQSELFDQSGNYFVYRGITTGNIIRNHDGSTVASETLQTRGPRALGANVAQQNLVGAISNDVTGWVRQSLTVDNIGIAANDLVVRVPRTRTTSVFVSEFIQQALAIDGVSSCVLIDRDDANSEVTFRVVYFPRKIPEGIQIRLENAFRSSSR
jgi:hypothetical protein